MKKILALLISLLIGAPAFADSCATTLMPAFTASQAVTICTKYGGALQNSLIPATTNAVDLGSSSKTFRNSYIGTDEFFTSTTGGQPIFPAASVITPSTSVPTPSAGNTLSNKRTVLAAGAPTAAYVVLPVITANVGRSWTVYNQGSNPLAIVPQTGVINVSAALTPFSCTTLKECECTAINSSGFSCSQK